MIRMMTDRNFPLLDLQIEAAYRRRCRQTRAGPCVCLEDMDDIVMMRAMRDARRRLRRGCDWLRRLAHDLDVLSQKPARASHQAKPPRLVAANSRRRIRATRRNRRL